MKLRKLLPLLITGSATFLLFFRNLPLSDAWAYGDSAMLPSQPGVVLNSYLFSWQQFGLGYAGVRVGISSVLVSLIVGVSGNSIIVQKMLLLGVFPVAMASMFLLARRISGYTGALIAAISYAVNPVIIADFIGGEVGLDLGPLWLYALLPLTLLLTMSILKGDHHRERNAALLSIILGATSVALHVMVFALLPIAILSAAIIVDKKSSLKNLGLIVAAVLLAFAMQLPTVMNYLTIGSNLPFVQASVTTDIRYTYSSAMVSNLLRMAGNAGSAQRLLGYNVFTFWGALGYLLTALAVVGFMVTVVRPQGIDSRAKYIAWTAIILVIFSCALASLVNSGYVFLLTSISAGATLRNPMKLLYFIAFGLSILAGLGTDKILRFLPSRKKITSYAVVTLVILTVVASNSPALNGTAGLSTVRGDSYTVPQRYFEMVNWLNSQQNNGSYSRALWLPYTFLVQERLTWIYPNEFGAILASGLQGVSTSFPKRVFDDVCGKADPVSFARVIAAANVRFIVVDLEDPTQTSCQSSAQYVTGNSTSFVTFLSQQSGIFPTYHNFGFLVFENRKVFPHIYMATYNTTSYSEAFLPHSSTSTLLVRQMNPTFYRVSISSVTEDVPFLLVLGESFDTGWEALINGIPVSESNHIISNQFSNGWLIVPPKSQFVVELIFSPQTTHYVGVVSSIAAFCFSLSILAASLLGQFRKKDRRLKS